MAHEVDFLRVGDGERGGDAIAVRFGNLVGDRTEQFVLVIDGGTQTSGQDLVRHIKTYYATDVVDLVVSTHPDSDHIRGLAVVLEDLDVRRLWMHKPWDHAEDIRQLFRHGRITDASLRENLRRSLENANDLEQIALRKGIPIDEPFACESLPFSDIGVHVLGPSREYYQNLLPHFRDTPQPRADLMGTGGLLATIATTATRAITWLVESWGIETLADPDENATSAENNSSVILFLRLDGKDLLFTGDAGVPALDQAAQFAEEASVALTELSFIQAPHHGSRRNVGPSILDRILGPKAQQPESRRIVFVSASKEGDPKHPSRRVSNAFQRRGAKGKVFATQGNSLQHHHYAPARQWGIAPPLPFHDQVEE